MPRYFMDLHECGAVTRDDEGQGCSDLAAARDVAVRGARGIMCAELAEGHLCLDCWIEILAEDRSILERIYFKDTVAIAGRDPHA